eukprot:6179595-Pleurochrysis_carterae.AAC.3
MADLSILSRAPVAAAVAAAAALGFAVGVSISSLAIHRKAASSEEEVSSNVSDDDSTLQGQPLKMVLVVRTDLKMGKGKIAAQCCHAAVHCFEEAQQVAPHRLDLWEESNGTAKVVVKCDSEDELLRVAAGARAAGLVHSLISDAGRTQIAAGSRTVCGVGPATEQELASITGHLKLM